VRKSVSLLVGSIGGRSPLAPARNAVLQPVFQQFLEGFETADLKVAEQLLATLR
jgi:hypothetical protein